MSEQRQPASISGPRRKQDFIDGKLPESRKRCVVESVVAESEQVAVAVAASLAPRESTELLLAIEDRTLIFAGQAEQEDGSSISCELRLGTETYGVLAVEEVELDGRPVLRVSPTASKVLGTRMDAAGALFLKVFPAQRFAGRLLSPVEEGQVIDVMWRRVRTEYYGTLICVPRQNVAYAQKLERLQRDWRRENSEPMFKDGVRNPLPDRVQAQLELEAEVGTTVVGFEDFTDDRGPIAPTTPDGRLNEEGLLSLLMIRDFHDALNAFYQGDAFDIEEALRLEKKLSNASPLTLNGQTPSANVSPPS